MLNMNRWPVITRIRLRNFRSIAACDAALGRLTLLVGANGSGKSSLLQALRLVSDALRLTLAEAVQRQGGLEALLYRGADRQTALGIELTLSLPEGRSGEYLIKIGGGADGEPLAVHERAAVKSESGTVAAFEVVDGQFAVPLPGLSAEGGACHGSDSSRRGGLCLAAVSVLPEIRLLYEALAGMAFYDIDPRRMRVPQPADDLELLRTSGCNVGDVLERLACQAPHVCRRLFEYMAVIVPDLQPVPGERQRGGDALLFDQLGGAGPRKCQFRVADLSNGTLRALALLVAVMQRKNDGRPLSLVGIEGPERAIHPAAIPALLDAFREAATDTQILLTTQSPDTLDQLNLDDDVLLAAVKQDGTSHIAPVDQAATEVLQQRLYSPGELLRMNHLEPEMARI
jgi:predicted ATPase